MLVCQYCKTTFHKKTFFCRNCSKPILNEYGCQLLHPLLNDKNEDLSFNFQVIEEQILYFEKEFANYEMEDVNFNIQVNEIIKLLYFFCEKTEYKKVLFEMAIESNGLYLEPIDFVIYMHEEKMDRIEESIKDSLKWNLDICRKSDGIIVEKIDKIHIKLEPF